MSTSSSASRTPQTDAPYATQRRRTMMACVNCRRRKMRCITTEQPPRNPCARCTKKGLNCEYVSADRDDDSSANQSSSEFPESSAHPARPPMPPPSRATQSWPNPSDFSRGPGTAPPLPYTGPPPLHMRPRYSGNAQYPDLSLSNSGPGQQNLPAQYYPTPATNSAVNQGYNPQAGQAYQYMANYGPPAAQPGHYPPGNGGYPPNFGGMPYYGDASMPEQGWPPHSSSDPRYR
ncbi:hypothetical protein K438DRAFT_1989316 [Mycena galopus ATCC 62051]|nr:hypothetical protein K438DRAFT_1989316 [Mycena galopus ATCC 62051]